MPRDRAFEGLEAGQVLALRGGMKSGWSVVNVHQTAGEAAFGVSAKEAWLMDHAFGHRSKVHEHAAAAQSVANHLRTQADKA
eukprot:12831928-Alexandrium_andersonii.AAC.1